jgi:hypothetical protein
MPTLSEFRSRYPQYNDIPDDDLLARLNERGVRIDPAPPERPGVIGNLARSAGVAALGIGEGTYTLAEELARRYGFDSVADWARARAEHNRALIQERPTRQLDPNNILGSLADDPMGVASGAIGQALGSIPFALTPAGWAVLFGAQAGGNIEEQREAQGIQPGEASLSTALPAAALQTLAERMFGIEGMVARGVGRGAGGVAQRFGRGALEGSVGEGLTEGFQEAVQIIQGDIGSPGRVLEPEGLGRVGAASMMGAIGGGAVRGALSTFGPERTQPQPDPGLDIGRIEEALGVLQQAQPARPAVVPLVSAPVSLPDPLVEAMVSSDPVEREIALSAVPDDQKIATLATYRRERDATLRQRREGVERPPGQWGPRGPVSAGAPPAPIIPTTATQASSQVPPTEAQAPAETQERSQVPRSPIEDMVAGMQPAETLEPVAGLQEPAEAPVAEPAPPQQAEAETPPTATPASPQPGEPAVAPRQPQQDSPPQEPEAEGRPSPERLAEAQAVIDEALQRFEQRGAQGARAAEGLRSMIADRLRSNIVTPTQAAAAFSMAEDMSNILPAGAGQAVEFVERMTRPADGTELQGTQTRLGRRGPDGLQGIIRLSLAPEQLPIAGETAAHEAWHAVEYWIRASDPRLHRALMRAFPQREDGTVRVQDIDSSILRLMRRHVHTPSGQTYFDYLSSIDTGRGPGVFPGTSEAMAYTFGALYDMRRNGVPVTTLKAPLRRVLDIFSELMDRIRRSPARSIMEDVASGEFRRREGDREVDITTEGLNAGRAEDTSRGVEEEPGREPVADRGVPEERASERGLPGREVLPGSDGTVQPEPEVTQESSRPFDLMPAEALAAAGIPQTQRGAAQAALIERNLPHVLTVQRSVANRVVRDRLASTRDGVPLTDILNDIGRVLPNGYAPLIEAIKRSSIPGLKVFSNLDTTFTLTDGSVVEVRRNVGSHYLWYNNPDDGLIYIDLDQTVGQRKINAAHAVLHEALHAATGHRISQLEAEARGGSDSAHRKLMALDFLRAEVAEKAAREKMLSERLGSAGTLRYALSGSSTSVTVFNPAGRHEFLAEAMTSPEFQTFLSTVPVSDELVSFMRDAGFDQQPRTLLDAFVEWVKGALGLRSDTALDATFILAPEFFSGSLPADPEEVVQESRRELPKSTQDMLDRLVNQERHGWMGRFLDNRVWKGGMKSELAMRIRMNVVDRYAPLERMEKILTGQNRLMADMSGYTSVWMAEDADRFVTQMVMEGKGLRLKMSKPGDLGSAYFEVTDGPGSMKWLGDLIGKAKDGEEVQTILKAFQAYAIAKRGTNLNAQGILQPIGARERQAADDALKVFPEIKKAYDGYQEFNRNLMNVMVQSGVLKQEDANAFMKYNDYYPFYRAIPKQDPLGLKRIAGIGSKFKPKEIVGGDEKFMDDPLTVITNNISYWTHAAMRNVAKQKVVNVGRQIGVMRPFDPKTDDPAGRVNVRVNGVDYAFTSTDPLVTAALESYVGLPDSFQHWLHFFGWPAKVLREFVTKSPPFMVYTNLIRDSVSAWQASGADIVPIASTYRGMIDAVTGDPDVKRYIELGHGGSRRYEDSFFRNAGDLLSDDIRVEKGVYRASTPGMLADILRHAYLKWDKLSEASDIATRVAIFRSELERTGNEAEAAWRAREVMNFTKRGSNAWLRAVAALVPFTNARIQGMDVMYQSLYGGGIGDPSKTRKDKLGKAMVRAAILSSIAVAIAAAFDDDDEIKETPRWMRNQNVLIPLRALGLADEGVLAIPKPFEYGTLFMTLPEQLLRVFRGTENIQRVAQDIPATLVSGMAFNPIPTAALPFFEQAANYSFFTGRPIVGQSISTQPVELRYTRATPAIYRDISAAAARIAHANGIELPDFMAPARMDHFVRSWTGTIGTYVATAVGALVGSDEFVNFDWRKMPVISSMIRTQQTTQPAGVDELYRLIEASDTLTQTLRHYARIGDEEMVRVITENNRGLIDIRSSLNQIKRRQQRIAQQQRAIMRDPRIPAERKREQIEALDRQMRETVRTVEALRLRAGR